MGLPAKRRTKQSKRERATHLRLAQQHLVTCSHCQRKIRPHRVCPHCGYYHGRAVVILATRSERRQRKQKKSQAQA